MRFWRPVGPDEGPGTFRPWFAWYPVRDSANGGYIWLERVIRSVHPNAYHLPRAQWRYVYNAIAEHKPEST